MCQCTRVMSLFVIVLGVTLVAPSLFANEIIESSSHGVAQADDDRGFEFPMLHARFGAGILSFAQSWTQSPDTTSASFPSRDFGFTQSLGSSIGFETSFSIWWEDIMAPVDLRIQWVGYNLSYGQNPDAEKSSDSISSVLLGSRYHTMANDWLHIEGGLWFHHTDAIGMKYPLETEDLNGDGELGVDHARVDVLNFSVDGLRLGVAGMVEFGDLSIRLELAETFAMAPVSTGVDLRVSYRIPEFAPDYFPPLVVGLHYGLEARYMRFDVATAGIKINEQIHRLGVGVTFEIDYLDRFVMSDVG